MSNDMARLGTLGGKKTMNVLPMIMLAVLVIASFAVILSDADNAYSEENDALCELKTGYVEYVTYDADRENVNPSWNWEILTEPTGDKPGTCKLVKPGNSSYYFGRYQDNVMPSEVTINKKKYIPTEVGDYAFEGASGYNVEIAVTVTKIGAYAFKDANIQHMIIPNNGSCTYIGDYAFANMNNLGSIGLAGTVEELGVGVFSQCVSLKDFDLSACTNMESSGEATFKGCTAMETMILPKNSATFTTIGESCFENAGNINNLELPNSVTTIEEKAFYKCKISGELYFNEGTKLAFIGSKAAGQCPNLTGIDLRNIKSATIEKDAFEGWAFEKVSGKGAEETYPTAGFRYVKYEGNMRVCEDWNDILDANGGAFPEPESNGPTQNITITFNKEKDKVRNCVIKDSTDLVTPTYSGHAFVGWYYKNDKDQEVSISATTVLPYKSGLVIYAKWILPTDANFFIRDGMGGDWSAGYNDFTVAYEAMSGYTNPIMGVKADFQLPNNFAFDSYASLTIMKHEESTAPTAITMLSSDVVTFTKNVTLNDVNLIAADVIFGTESTSNDGILFTANFVSVDSITVYSETEFDVNTIEVGVFTTDAKVTVKPLTAKTIPSILADSVVINATLTLGTDGAKFSTSRFVMNSGSEGSTLNGLIIETDGDVLFGSSITNSFSCNITASRVVIGGALILNDSIINAETVEVDANLTIKNVDFGKSTIYLTCEKQKNITNFNVIDCKDTEIKYNYVFKFDDYDEWSKDKTVFFKSTATNRELTLKISINRNAYTAYYIEPKTNGTDGGMAVVPSASIPFAVLKTVTVGNDDVKYFEFYETFNAAFTDAKKEAKASGTAVTVYILNYVFVDVTGKVGEETLSVVSTINSYLINEEITIDAVTHVKNMYRITNGSYTTFTDGDKVNYTNRQEGSWTLKQSGYDNHASIFVLGKQQSENGDATYELLLTKDLFLDAVDLRNTVVTLKSTAVTNDVYYPRLVVGKGCSENIFYTCAFAEDDENDWSGQTLIQGDEGLVTPAFVSIKAAGITANLNADGNIVMAETTKIPFAVYDSEKNMFVFYSTIEAAISASDDGIVYIVNYIRTDDPSKSKFEWELDTMAINSEVKLLNVYRVSDGSYTSFYYDKYTEDVKTVEFAYHNGSQLDIPKEGLTNACIVLANGQYVEIYANLYLENIDVREGSAELSNDGDVFESRWSFHITEGIKEFYPSVTVNGCENTFFTCKFDEPDAWVKTGRDFLYGVSPKMTSIDALGKTSNLDLATGGVKLIDTLGSPFAIWDSEKELFIFFSSINDAIDEASKSSNGGLPVVYLLNYIKVDKNGNFMSQENFVKIGETIHKSCKLETVIRVTDGDVSSFYMLERTTQNGNEDFEPVFKYSNSPKNYQVNIPADAEEQAETGDIEVDPGVEVDADDIITPESGDESPTSLINLAWLVLLVGLFFLFIVIVDRKKQ